VASCSLLGIAYSRVARTAKSAEAVVTPPFIALQFVSGVWIPLQQLPAPLQLLGNLLPLRWIVQGMRAVFLPDSFLAQEPTGTWQLPLTFAVLGAWTVGGAVLCLLTFRWRGREDR
jgi:ABC-2 type transport system permease protein